MSDDRSWWPEGFDLPAFRVKRETYGSEVAGDYTRGSTVPALHATALRYPTDAIDLTAVSNADRGLLFAKASDRALSHLYTTIEIEWNWPKGVHETFREVAVVRSSYGAPSSPNQGVTIFRKMREDLLLDSEGELLPPQILYDYFPPPKVMQNGVWVDGLTANGRWYYYTAFFTTNGADWTPMMSDACLLPSNYRHTDHLWDAVPPYYQWVDDNLRVGNGFLRQFLTVFGFELDRTREYVESVLELHHIDQSPMLLLKHLGDNYGYPWEEGIGDIRYRALMANISHLISIRGTAKGLLELVETVAKYDCDLTYGANTVLLPDDSNFMTPGSVGHWVPMHPNTTILGASQANYLTWDKVRLTQTTIPLPAPSGTGATGAMLVDSADAETLDFFIALGNGKMDMPGTTPDRELLPYDSGIPINPGETYGLSAYVKAAKSVTANAYLLPFASNGQPASLITSTTPGYLTPSVGTASTPNFAGTQITNDTVWVAKLRKNAVGSTGKIASKLLAGGVYAWEWYIDTANGDMRINLSNAAGTVGNVYAPMAQATWQTIPAGQDVYLALWIDASKGSYWYFGVLYSTDGYVWSEMPDGSTPPIESAGSYSGGANTAPIVVGNTSGGTAGLFDGRIYWVEQRTGFDPRGGTVVWRFDANEYVSGTTFTDARGKVWTMTSGTAATAKVQALDPVAGSPKVINDAGAGWTEVTVQGTMPVGAGYMVPALYFDARTTGGIAGRSPAIYVAAVMVYRIESQTGSTTTIAPDRYLVMGNPAELMGETRVTPPYTGFQIGSPKT